MSKDVVDRFLAEIGSEPPCGPDLRYDPAYLELDGLLQRKTEEEPNWRDVYARAADLLGRTKDLRVALYLALALLKTEGIPGIRDGLMVVRGFLDRFWDHVHPQLDPEDDNDPLERLNIIASLSPPPESYQDPLLFKQRLREVSLCNSPQLGSFSLRDILIAEGELKPPPDSESPKPEISVINAAFEDTSTDELKKLAEAAGEATDHIIGIEAALRAHVDAGRVPDLSGFQGILAAIRGRLESHLTKRGIAPSGAKGEEGPGKPATESGKEKPVSGEIRSAEDVVSALEKICQYYERNEPSSPVPLLLRRAQRLVSKSFLEIIRDLSPEAKKQIENIGGVSGDAAKG